MSSWLRNIAQNLISNAVWAVGALVVSIFAVWFTYLTPALLPYAPLSYLFMALLALVLLSIVAERAARAWRHFKPSAEPAGVTATHLNQRIDYSGDLEARVAALEQRSKDIGQDCSDLSGRFALAEERAGKAIKALSDKMEGHVAGLLQRMQVGESGNMDVRRGAAKLEETVEKNEKYVRESFYALQAREQLKELSAEIERDAADLSTRLKAGENYTKQDWDQWTNVEHHWERAVKVWVDVARWYAKDVKKAVMTIADEEYDDPCDLEVQDSQFPSADAVRRFKRHRIIHRHWMRMKDDVEEGTIKVAFQAGTEQEQHGGKHH